MPYKHIVMFSVGEEHIASIKAELLKLPERISEIKSYELGVDLKLKSGQKHPAGKNRTISWSAVFDSVEDYEKYSSDPHHVGFLRVLKPFIETGSRAAIQYEVCSTSP